MYLYYKDKQKHSNSNVQRLIGCLRPALMASFLENYCIFVGDLGADVDDVLLMTFQSQYKLAVSAKVMVDPTTGFSKEFGFIRFFDEAEQ